MWLSDAHTRCSSCHGPFRSSGRASLSTQRRKNRGPLVGRTVVDGKGHKARRDLVKASELFGKTEAMFVAYLQTGITAASSAAKDCADVFIPLKNREWPWPAGVWNLLPTCRPSKANYPKSNASSINDRPRIELSQNQPFRFRDSSRARNLPPSPAACFCVGRPAAFTCSASSAARIQQDRVR